MNIDNLNKETSNETDDRYSEADIFFAYRALKNGKATPKQQKIVYKERQKKIEKEAQKQRRTPSQRNLLIHGILNHPEGKKEKMKDIFKEIAEEDYVSIETVRHSYYSSEAEDIQKELNKIKMMKIPDQLFENFYEKKYKL